MRSHSSLVTFVQTSLKTEFGIDATDYEEQIGAVSLSRYAIIHLDYTWRLSIITDSQGREQHLTLGGKRNEIKARQSLHLVGFPPTEEGLRLHDKQVLLWLNETVAFWKSYLA